MEVGTNFALQKIAHNLYSVVFKNANRHAFEEIFDNWNDIECLFDFFEEHQTDLQSEFWTSLFGKIISTEEAIERTRRQTGAFEKKIIDLANSTTAPDETNLSSLFVPLIKQNSTRKPLLNSTTKAYGLAKTSWLRVYAVRIADVFIITGGAIKLTPTMEERPHTQNELDKLLNVASILKRNHFNENTDFDTGYIDI
ncbi:MAG TPA: hypothetical protein DCR35_08670 [Runella sp.]|nr:hypothetical protein [Runella sp.]HAO49358.1 hypothetical protein [Runella sp.]